MADLQAAEAQVRAEVAADEEAERDIGIAEEAETGDENDNHGTTTSTASEVTALPSPPADEPPPPPLPLPLPATTKQPSAGINSNAPLKEHPFTALKSNHEASGVAQTAAATVKQVVSTKEDSRHDAHSGANGAATEAVVTTPQLARMKQEAAVSGAIANDKLRQLNATTANNSSVDAGNTSTAYTAPSSSSAGPASATAAAAPATTAAVVGELATGATGTSKRAPSAWIAAQAEKLRMAAGGTLG
jgi:hypothetical protein